MGGGSLRPSNQGSGSAKEGCPREQPEWPLLGGTALTLGPRHRLKIPDVGRARVHLFSSSHQRLTQVRATQLRDTLGSLRVRSTDIVGLVSSFRQNESE